MFDENKVTLTVDLERKWSEIERVYKKAKHCQKYHKDENAWVQVVYSVLQLAGIGHVEDMLEVNSIQTQIIDSTLLPILPDNVTPLAKRPDLAIGFNLEHEMVRLQVDKVNAKRPGMALSHMTDAYTSTVPLACGIEIKCGGDYNEAVM
ncbi:hypothetical protein MMC13_005409 [Lambiella insularis]|nr:hypothetical protein [Lambiella insularis]